MNSDTNGLPTHSMPRASRQIPSGVYRLSNCAHTRLLTRLPSAAISNTVRRLAKLSARMSLRPSGVMVHPLGTIRYSAGTPTLPAWATNHSDVGRDDLRQ